VEEILKSRKLGRGTQYLVKWKEYPRSEATWEPCSQLLKHAQDVVKDWEESTASMLFRFEVEASPEEGAMSGDDFDEQLSNMLANAE
jgi:hypothetical protein